MPFIRFNETDHWWEKDTSAGSDGSGPWVELVVDGSQIGIGNLNVARLPLGGTWTITSDLNLSGKNLKVSPSVAYGGVEIDSSDTPTLGIKVSGTTKAQIGVSTGANKYMAGDAANDLALRSDSGNIVFSADAGTTMGMRLITVSGTTQLQVISDTADTIFIELKQGTTLRGHLVYFQSDSKLYLSTSGGLTNGLRMDSSGNVEFINAVKLATLGAFAASDKYVIVDASGNLHKSALGPAS